MIFQWRGLSSFKIKSNNLFLLIDPLSRSQYELKPLTSKADICLLSSDFLFYEKKILENSSHIFRNPGEYEARGINIQISPSFGSDNVKNNIFSIKWQGIKIVHLGALKQKNSINKALEKINGTDILMIPVGNNKVIGASDAVEIIHRIEPSIVIPMFYKIEKRKNVFDLDDVKYFIQEMGQEIEELDKLKIEKSSLNKDKTRLVVLKPL
jgi:L-ascorbate metabolism protein UlaG (beta-lactamase superfamily)